MERNQVGKKEQKIKTMIPNRVDELNRDSFAFMPVAQLKKKYSKDPLRLCSLQGVKYVSVLLYAKNTLDSVQWSLDYFCWIVEAMDYPKKERFIEYFHHAFVTLDERKRWKLPVKVDVFTFSCSLLDTICLQATNISGATEMIYFLLQRGYPSHCSLSWCLFFGSQNELGNKRLLDAGADLSYMRDDPTARMLQIRDWYHARQRCRMACIALLSGWRHSPIMRAYTTRDIVDLIARALWAQRWKFH